MVLYLVGLGLYDEKDITLRYCMRRLPHAGSLHATGPHHVLHGMGRGQCIRPSMQTKSQPGLLACCCFHHRQGMPECT